MADGISQSDIQHAVDNALHDVRNDVSRISHIIDGLNRTGQDIRDLTHRLQSLEQSVNQIQNTVANTIGRPLNRRYPDPYVVSMMNDVNDLKIRFGAVEKLIEPLTEYLRRRNEREAEDEQYRNT